MRGVASAARRWPWRQLVASQAGRDTLCHSGASRTRSRRTRHRAALLTAQLAQPSKSRRELLALAHLARQVDDLGFARGGGALLQRLAEGAEFLLGYPVHVHHQIE